MVMTAHVGILALLTKVRIPCNHSFQRLTTCYFDSDVVAFIEICPLYIPIAAHKYRLSSTACIDFVGTLMIKYLQRTGAYSMRKSAYLTIRIDPNLKAEAAELFDKLGFSTTDAVTMFLHQALINGGLPFTVDDPSLSQPNRTNNFVQK